MPTENQTDNRGYPLPHADNDLDVDIARLVLALEKIDADMALALIVAAGVAGLDSPEFEGTPTAPTATPGTSTTQLATTAFVQAALNALVNAAPGALDTLNELAAALGDDPNFAATVTAAIAAKADAAHNHDDRYNTKAEAAALFAAIVHNHDDRYYTEAEVDAAIAAALGNVSSAKPGDYKWSKALADHDGWVLGVGQNILRASFPDYVASVTKASTGDTTNANAVISNVPVDLRFLGLEGAPIEGAGIPGGATVVSITANSLTLSANATATAVSIAFRIFPTGNGNGTTTIGVDDLRDFVVVGRGNAGGTAANRITSAISGLDTTKLIATGGDQRMQNHTHTITPNRYGIGDPIPGFGGGNYTNTAVTIGSAGSGNSQNVQPSRVANGFVYIGEEAA